MGKQGKNGNSDNRDHRRWTVEQMYELGTRHARIEAERDLDALMRTLNEQPVYEFYPLGMKLRGGERVRRYYAQFMESFMESILGYELLHEWVNETSVIQEYDITVRGSQGPETHRTLGILIADGDRGVLAGERIYGSERLCRN